MPRINFDTCYRYTDELNVIFVACPDCRFEYIPHGYNAYGASPYKTGFTASFCPGCGQLIEWIRPADDKED